IFSAMPSARCRPSSILRTSVRGTTSLPNLVMISMFSCKIDMRTLLPSPKRTSTSFVALAGCFFGSVFSLSLSFCATLALTQRSGSATRRARKHDMGGLLSTRSAVEHHVLLSIGHGRLSIRLWEKRAFFEDIAGAQLEPAPGGHGDAADLGPALGIDEDAIFVARQVIGRRHVPEHHVGIFDLPPLADKLGQADVV